MATIFAQLSPQPQEWNRYMPLYKKCLTTGGSWSGEFIVTGYQKNQLKDTIAASPIKRMLIIATSSRYFNRESSHAHMRLMNDQRWTLMMANPNQVMAYKFINCPNIPIVQATTNDGLGNYLRGHVPGFRFQFGFRYDNHLRLEALETERPPDWVPGQDPNLWKDKEWQRMAYVKYRDRFVYETDSTNNAIGGYQLNHIIQLAMFDCTDPNIWIPMNQTVSSYTNPVFYNFDVHVTHKKRTLFYVGTPLDITHSVAAFPVPDPAIDWKVSPPEENAFTAGPQEFLQDVTPVLPF